MKTFRAMLLAALAVAAQASVAGSAHAAVNLVGNGSFEMPLGSPWIYSGRGYGGADARTYKIKIIGYNNRNGYFGTPAGAFGELVRPDNAVSDSPDAVGGHAAYFVADNSIETLSQKIYFRPGRYEIGFSAYLPQNGVNNPVDASFTAALDGLQMAQFKAKGSGLKTKTWRAYSTSAVVTTPGFQTLAFTYNSRPPQGYTGRLQAADVVIDRVYAVAVPEPATWALMILGFGGAGAALRRRRVAAGL